MSESEEARVIDAIEALMPPVLTTLDVLGEVSRHLYPPAANQVAKWLDPFIPPLSESIKSFDGLAIPKQLEPVALQALGAARQALLAATEFAAAATDNPEPMGLYRALRKTTLAVEQLFPLAQVLVPVSRFFVEPESRDDAALLERLHQGSMRDDEVAVGVLNAGNARNQRGGFSLYVPEYYSADREWPLIVALHGGSGHGADFLWSWVREARTRGALVASVTSRDRTWSIMDENDVDAPNLKSIVERVAERYRVDPSKILLGGMSDGGTYTLLGGLTPDMPFSHLAPFSGVFHPLLEMNGFLANAAGRPVYLVHGVLDWMFEVDRARHCAALLQAAGANVTYREIADLSHTYARDENPRVLDWMGVSRLP